MKIYLAGAINGKTDAEAKNWREVFKKIPGHDWIDPMARDFRGQEEINVDAIVTGDKGDILSCDLVIAMANDPSWGTAMEIHFAHDNGIRVICICSKDHPSPWLVYHSQVVKYIRDVVDYLT